MSDRLRNMKPSHEYLVCVDSDGCVMDNMELKHKECFCPATVNVWELQGVSRYAREAAEFVNLYSRTRGMNRFPALIRTLELTYARPEVQARGYTMPDLRPLLQWIEKTPVLSAAALEQHYRSNGHLDPVLVQAARWSREVDTNVAHIVRNVPPFPSVKDALRKIGEFADIVVVSATPYESLSREWRANGLDRLVTVIAGQDSGTKKECIHKAMDGRYAPEKVLKVGDAPGDYDAAMSNGVLFYPIVPGREDDCWRALADKTAEVFHQGAYMGGCMQQHVDDFFATLLESPPWVTTK